ncbi:MAG: CHRD domain-containing protein [bacterium]|nr:CHRD domain-containing protein [bacterium]
MRKLLLVIVVLLAAFRPSAAQDSAHNHTGGEPRPETEQASPIPLAPGAGSEIGFVYQAHLSPQQEGGEEEDTPPFIPSQFRSTAPSVPRNERTSRGHGVVAFARDLSRAYVYLSIENVNVDEIVMLHLHCGRPGQLGPILVDFGLIGDVQAYLADGVMAVEVTNEDITAVLAEAEGLVGGFTSGCPIVSSNPVDKIVTVAGMQVVAAQGDLYFNLHTAGQVYFGDIRGQLHAAETAAADAE